MEKPPKNSYISLLLFSCTFLFLLLFILSSFIQDQEITLERSLRKNVFKYATDPQPHLQLAEYYAKQNNFDLAEKELALSLSRNVTQVIPQELTQISSIQKEYQHTIEKIDAVKSVLQEKPDYRDAWIQLSILSFRVYRTEEALYALEQAYLLDPNEEAIKNLRDLLPWISY